VEGTGYIRWNPLEQHMSQEKIRPSKHTGDLHHPYHTTFYASILDKQFASPAHLQILAVYQFSEIPDPNRHQFH